MGSTESDSNTSENFGLFNHLITLGNYFALDRLVRQDELANELAPFRNDWKVYNPTKGNFGRYGLSLTSLDGGLGGTPDLTSLFEYNAQNGTRFNEMSFRELTPVYKACPTVHSLVEPFLPYLGRSHFIKFDRGGYFPYHRDSFSLDDEVFRIFVPMCGGGGPHNFVFLLGHERITFELGRAYFINTRKEHALFSFDESVHLVLNVHLNRNSVKELSKIAYYV